MTTYVAYIRTSTDRQNLGLDAQRSIIERYLKQYSGELVDTYVEQVSGTKADRKELTKALKQCKKEKHTLLVAKLDRLSRKVSFISTLIDTGVDLKVAELPSANTFVLHLMACVGEEERRALSERTKAALAERKKQGVQLGSPKNEEYRNEAIAFARSLNDHIEAIRQSGVRSYTGIARALNEQEIPTRNNGKWYSQTVKNYLQYETAI